MLDHVVAAETTTTGDLRRLVAQHALIVAQEIANTVDAEGAAPPVSSNAHHQTLAEGERNQSSSIHETHADACVFMCTYAALETATVMVERGMFPGRAGESEGAGQAAPFFNRSRWL